MQTYQLFREGLLIMNQIFVDTGPLLARYIAADQFHQRSIKLWDKLNKQPLITSNHVTDEFLTLLARRTTYPFAVERASSLYSSQALTVIQSTIEDEKAAIEYFHKYADSRVSFTDCISFAICKRLKVKKVFSFDKHFSLCGFKLL